MTRGPVIDWNPHVYSRDRGRYPLHPRGIDRPEDRHLEDDPAQARLQRMDEAGIDGTVLVQAGAYGDDHRLLLDCLARAPGRLRGSALFFPRDPAAPDKLAELASVHKGIVAVRFHGHPHYQDSFAQPGVRALWRRAGELGLVVEVHFRPPLVGQVAAAVQADPEVPVLVDHLARPREGTAVEYAAVLDLARFPGVYMKMSGLDLVGGTPPLYLEAGSFLRRVADAFGPERLVWSGDTPSVVEAHLGHWSGGDRDRVRGGNLAELLGFHPRRAFLSRWQ